MLELDVHLTADHQVVVSHDKNLFRSTGVDKNISDVKFSELPLIKEQLTIDFDPGKSNHMEINILLICLHFRKVF